jgi:hypothetical protein
METLSRRTFFLRTAALAGAAAMAPALSGCNPFELSPELSESETSILSAVTETLYPSTPPAARGEPAPGLTLAQQVAKVIGEEADATRKMFRGALWVVELAALPVYGKGFRRLPSSQRAEHFLSLQNSRLATARSAVQGLARATYFVAYSRPETWDAIGYDGPWIHRVTP